MNQNTVLPKKASRVGTFTHIKFVLESLVARDFKLKYRRSILGVLWSVLNPLLMMAVLAAVFSFMFRFSIENFALYLILGNILFTFMANATTGAMESILNAEALIKKIRIEKMVFPIEKVLFELLNFVVSLVAAALVMVYYQVAPSIYIFALLPLLMIYMLLFCAGLGLLLSALAVFFRDVVHLWGVIITAWTYATPLFYPYEMLAEWMQALMQWNPMFHYVNYFRSFMMWNTVPSLSENLICLAMAVVTFLIGYFVFKKTEKKFILYV